MFMRLPMDASLAHEGIRPQRMRTASFSATTVSTLWVGATL